MRLLVFFLLLFPAAVTRGQSSVTICGDLQAELGCSGDWQPDCAVTHLALDAEDAIWQGTFAVPAGSFEYKAAIDDAWAESYGTHATLNGTNIGLDLAAETEVKFYYDHASHWITDSVRSVIATAIGDFQSELGCASNYDSGCLRSWMQDVDGDGTYTLVVALPAGSYQAQVALDEATAEVYGASGQLGGAAIPFDVATHCADQELTFTEASKEITITESSLSQPSSVTVVGDCQTEVGCAGDWQPDCALSHLIFEDGVWQGTFSLPAGSFEYKVAIDDDWAENYGAGGVLSGPNIAFDLGAATDVTFYYDHGSHWVTDSVGSIIATAAGDFQDELGCSADWEPACARAWLQDPDGDGVFVFRTRSLPGGSYVWKVAINEGWDENYGEGGVLDGADIPFVVPLACTWVELVWDSTSHLPTVVVTCSGDGDCDDGNACTADVCDSGGCSNTTIACDDDVSCTVDGCDPSSGCTTTPDDSVCDNGQYCDGVETCDGILGCQSGTSPCDGRAECNASCDETHDDCFDAAGTACGDAATTDCDAADTCDGAGHCIDNVAADNTSCASNSVFCDGAEICSAGVCVSPGSPCAALQTCDETDARCVTPSSGPDPSDPKDEGCGCAASGSGGWLIALLVLAMRRRRS